MFKKASCPVMFYIHGGILNFESAVMFDDQFITDRYSSKDIVFVISAFRLGFFGVLAFEDDKVIPRNLALYDIIAGLEFIHQEVAAFGGDPNRVTVMGHSQGGSIAMIFAASSVIDPEKRLFQQLIALSPALNYRSTAERADLTWRLAHEVGARPMICSSTTSEFNLQHNDEIYDIGAFLVVKHPAEIRRKYFEDKREGKFEDSYLSQVVFTLNVLFGSIFTGKGSKVYLMEYNQKPFPVHSIDMQNFIGLHMRPMSKNDKVIDKFYAESLVNFAHGRIPNKDWRSFDPRTRNYYSLEVDLDKCLLPSNKWGYHSAVVDYWLKNITKYDESLSQKTRSGLLNTVTDTSFLRKILIISLFGLAAVILLTMLLALCSYLSPHDPPVHERAPLIVHKRTSKARGKSISVAVPAVSSRR
ncbi:Carboxylesterase [Oesophagostomum dentatum]|uniref:Carboxylesterase n=1 Tax=Oesophagostomum dentatum TaxID=61180 RepID=A0A0B1TT22_OESDE|nr:Carboxylesterase [Oesophagostomum dentatum]